MESTVRYLGIEIDDAIEIATGKSGAIQPESIPVKEAVPLQ